MLIRARCNRRCCQARKTFKKRLSEYVRWPTCHMCGKGRMYEDKFRTSKRENDYNGLCMCDGVPSSIRNAPHRRGSPGCKHREEHVLGLLVKKKHSPRRNDASEEPGF